MSEQKAGAICDVVLPVYNNVHFVKECIDSIIKYTYTDYNLFIIDDNSDTYTSNYLKEVKKKYNNIHLYHNELNKGFLQSCNFGIKLGQAPYVLIINSDVIVTPDWLGRMIKCAESDQRIASVNPLTNQASNIDIPIVPGANFFGMDEILRNKSLNTYPDIVTGVGFCMLLRRSVLDSVGLFDEVYGHGYCEESDLCMRLTTNGYRTVIADNVYVYHKGRVSFNDREERYKNNRKIFDKRWSLEYQRQFTDFKKKDPLKAARELFMVKQSWDPVPHMRQTYRLMREKYRERDFTRLIKEAWRGLKGLPKAKRNLITPEMVDRVTRKDRLRVTYVLPQLVVAGGVLSVIQLVNELILLGVEARIVALREYPEIYDWKFYTRPIIFKSEQEMLKNFPESDFVIATHWTTARWVAEVINSGKASKAVYFLQDYESWFYPANDFKNRKAVLSTYNLISNKIVKSDWLSSLLKKDGFETKKIRLGMDLSLYYPRQVDKNPNPVILAMARPRTARRGFPYVKEALRLVKAKIPEVEIILFGDDLSKEKIPFEYQDAGVITNQNKIAELYSKADVFLDGSNFQGFGRPALEAMACGTACVLTEVGGVTEYARNKENCLLVPPKEPEKFAEAIISILKDNLLKQKLIQGGQKTVRDYCHKREALETLEYFNQIFENDFTKD